MTATKNKISKKVTLFSFFLMLLIGSGLISVQGAGTLSLALNDTTVRQGDPINVRMDAQTIGLAQYDPGRVVDWQSCNYIYRYDDSEMYYSEPIKTTVVGSNPKPFEGTFTPPNPGHYTFEAAVQCTDDNYFAADNGPNYWVSDWQKVDYTVTKLPSNACFTDGVQTKIMNVTKQGNMVDVTVAIQNGDCMALDYDPVITLGGEEHRFIETVDLPPQTQITKTYQVDWNPDLYGAVLLTACSSANEDHCDSGLMQDGVFGI